MARADLLSARETFQAVAQGALIGPLVASLALHIALGASVVYGIGVPLPTVITSNTTPAKPRPPLQVVPPRAALPRLAMLTTSHLTSDPEPEIAAAADKPSRPESTEAAPPAEGVTQASPRLGLIPLPLPRYLDPAELSERPRAETEVGLVYPENAPLIERGRVILQLLIGENGRVDDTVIEESDLPPELQAMARDAFLQARFRPGMLDARAVKSRIRVEILFEGGPPPPAMLPATPAPPGGK